MIRVYYAIRKENGVLYWLGATKGAPEPLSEDEEANILWLAGDGPLPPSKAVRRPDGELDFTSGPLKPSWRRCAAYWSGNGAPRRCCRYME